MTEAGKARFEHNFGTSICNDCDGLKAGPGVSATCFQTRQCYFSNVKEGEESPKLNRVIDRLVGP